MTLSQTEINPILEYYEKILSGQITVGDKIRRTYKKLVQDVFDSTGEFYYSQKRAEHVIKFIERYCVQSKGKYGGKLLKLELWQRAMLAAIFGFVDINGLRKYREAILIVGKKNGKSTLAAAIGLYMQVGDGEMGPEVYSVATKKDQAKIIWQESKRMVRKSPALRKRIKTLVADLSSEDYNDGSFKPLASDSDTLDGPNIHCVLMDEIHQWKNGLPLYQVMVEGTINREQPLAFSTSTAGYIREDLYDERYVYAKQVIDGYGIEDGYKDERFIAFIYELDKRDEWKDPNCYEKANPGLGSIKNRRTLEEKVAKARQNPHMLKALLTKEFNIPESAAQAWLPYEDCVNETLIDMEYLRDSYAIGGCDLSATRDLTCATVLIAKPNDENLYAIQQYFLPRARVEEVEGEAKKEAQYKLWAEQGWLTICESATVDYHQVTEWFVSVVNNYNIRPLWICYDRALSGYWVPEMQEYGFEMENIPQGARTWTYPMKRLGGILSEHKIIYNNNPILRWCLLNTNAKSLNKDGIESIQPVKMSEKMRIDGTVSLLNAFTGYNTHETEYLQMVR